MSAPNLPKLEQRVTARYMEKCNAGWQIPDMEPLDVTAAMQIELPPGTSQFPREQWLIRPHRRTICLLVADRMIDLWDDLTDKQRYELSLLLSLGGRERIA